MYEDRTLLPSHTQCFFHNVNTICYSTTQPLHILFVECTAIHSAIHVQCVCSSKDARSLSVTVTLGTAGAIVVLTPCRNLPGLALSASHCRPVAACPATCSPSYSCRMSVLFALLSIRLHLVHSFQLGLRRYEYGRYVRVRHCSCFGHAEQPIASYSVIVVLYSSCLCQYK